MEDLTQGLEKRIRSLMQQCELLKESNNKLHQIKSQLLREKDLLLAKNKHAITQIEVMVNRLKSLEKTQ